MKDKQLGLNLEKEVQHTPTEIMQEAVSALLVEAQSRRISGETAAEMVEIIRELLHWAFSKPGVHSTPAELLVATLAMNGADTKDGKPKIDA